MGVIITSLIKMAKIVAKLLMPKVRGQLVKRSSRVDLVNVANLGNVRNRSSHSSPLQSYEIPPSDSSRVPCLEKAVKLNTKVGEINLLKTIFETWLSSWGFRYLHFPTPPR